MTARGTRPFFAPSTGLRAVVSDVDGTLTGPDRVLSSEAAELLRAVRRSGTPVILATGNVLPIALALQRSVGLDGPIVAENGGLIYRREGGRDVVTRLADRRPAWAAFRAARAAGLPLRRLFTDRWRETEVAVEPTVPADRIARAIASDRVTVEGTGFAVHFMQAGCGKRPALDRLLAELGLSWHDCLVAGDGDNDVGMLKAAGWAVSFPTASPRARAAADYVATQGHAAGFVEALKERARVGARR